MTELTLSPDGMLRGVSDDGKRWRVQMEADPAIPPRDWIARDYLYLRQKGFEQFKILANIWGDNWNYYESPKIVDGGLTTPATANKCGMTFGIGWKVEGTRITVDVRGLSLTPGLPCNFCIEISDFDQKNRPPEPTMTGDWFRTTENWRVRYWLVRGVSPATSVSGTLSWGWGPEAKPLFDGPVKEWRKFDYSEVPDISPYLGATKGWGTNVCAGAIHRLNETDMKAMLSLIKRMGFTVLRPGQYDSFGGPQIIQPDGKLKNVTIFERPDGILRLLRLWDGLFVIDGMHGYGDDSYKCGIFIDPVKREQYLTVRKLMTDCIVAENAGHKVIGWVDANENTVEWPFWSRFGLPDTQKAAKGKEVYDWLLSLPLPFAPKYRAATQAWGNLPAVSMENLAAGPAIAANNYMTKPGVIESARSLEWFIDQHRIEGKPCFITEWGNATKTAIMEDAHLAPPLQALLCVEKSIGVCCDFAWSQNEEVWQGNVKPWEGRLQASRALAMLPAALIFSRQERGYTRTDGTLRIDTGVSHGMAGRLIATDRIKPGFGTGIVLTQALGAGMRLVTVLGRSRGGKMTELELEKVSATVDGVTYAEGVHLVS